MSKIELTPDRLLRLKGGTFRQHETIRQALAWFKEKPEEFKERVGEIDSVISALNGIMKKPEIDENNFHDVKILRKMLDGKPLPTLEGLAKLQRLSSATMGKRPRILAAIEETITEIKEGLPPGGVWSWVTEIKDNPNKLGFGLLIEAYGRLWEKYYWQGKETERQPGLKRTFVLAFEEVLFTNFRESKLLGDIIDWMREEYTDFPPLIANELNLNLINKQQIKF